jgi:hypothetical protein
MQLRLRCALKKCEVAAASTIRESRCSTESTSHRHLRSLDWTGLANDLATQVIGHHTNRLLPMGPHLISDLHVAS